MTRLIVWLLAVLLLVATWILVRPGILVVQPIGALPEGVTLLYHSRGPNLPVVTSADGLCLTYQQSVSLLCRGMMLAGLASLSERVIIRLPYSQTAYLFSTNGQTFDR